jgi:hypothetical protein
VPIDRTARANLSAGTIWEIEQMSREFYLELLQAAMRHELQLGVEREARNGVRWNPRRNHAPAWEGAVIEMIRTLRGLAPHYEEIVRLADEADARAEEERRALRSRGVRAGLARARAAGKRLGRPARILSVDDLQRVVGLTVREAAKVLKVPRSAVHRSRQAAQDASQRTAK